MIEISKKECYKTVAGAGEAVYIDKKSKFLAHIRPVSDEEEALEFLQQMRSEYSDATHNVYAYIVDENNIFRYSDDGEPSGTSGMPVLDTMRKEGLVDVIAVVTRYFGGTLLGTGGLVHAYSAAARMGIEAAGAVTRVKCTLMSVRVPYNFLGKMQYYIASNGYILENSEYGTDAEFTVCLRREEVDKFISDAAELTCGRAIIKEKGEKYIDMKG